MMETTRKTMCLKGQAGPGQARALRRMAVIGGLAAWVLLSCAAWANNPPVANAGPDKHVYLGECVYLEGSAYDPDDDHIIEWFWLVILRPTGSTAQPVPIDESNPIICPDKAGEYLISLVVFDANIFSEPNTVMVTASVNQPPVAVASATPTSGPAPLTVQFDGSASSDYESDHDGRPPLTYAWTFGDGNTSTAMSPEHTYTEAGVYTARLTVRDHLGLTDTAEVMVIVGQMGNNPPVANAGPDKHVYLGECVFLEGSGCDPDGDDIVEWFWRVVVRPAGTKASPIPVYVEEPIFCPDGAGEYLIALIVSDGMDYSAPDTVSVTAMQNLPPVAVASATPTSGGAPLHVQFDASQSSDPEGLALTYVWTFGDGNTSTAMSPEHTYTDAGVYTARLTVCDHLGLTDFDVVTIEVLSSNQPPVIAPTANPTSGRAPLLVAFAANAEDADGDALVYWWDFGNPLSGDLNTSDQPNPSHMYAQPGTYPVQAGVWDGTNEWVWQDLVIAVDPPFGISVSSATIRFQGKKEVGSADVWAEMDIPLPTEDVWFYVTIDGITVAEAPFSAFVYQPGTGTYAAMGQSSLTLNFETGQLFASHRKLDLSSLTPGNGVEVRAGVGLYAAVETIEMTDAPGNKLVYVRPE